MKKIMVQFNFPGMTLKQYDQSWEECKAAGYEHPKGLLHHVGGMQGNNLVVTDVWESQEAFDKFGNVLMPILKKAGFANVKPVIIPVHYEYAGKELASIF